MNGIKTENFHVAGITYHMDAVNSLKQENPDYSMSKKEIEESYDVGEKIFQYDYDCSDCVLVPEDDNQYDKNAVRVDVHGVAIGYIKKGSASHVRNLLNSPDYKNATCEIVGGKYKVLCEGENDDGDDVTYVDKDDLPTFAVVTTYVATQDSEPEKAQGVPVSPVSPAPSYYAPAPDLQPSPVPSSGSGKPAKRRGRGFLLFFAIFFLLVSFVSFGSGNSGPGVFYIIVSVVLFVLYFRGRRK